MLDLKKIRQDFPALKRLVNGKPLVYLDNAATSQRPQQVIDAIVNFYSNHNANVHRGIHTLSEEATQMYEHARKNVAIFIGANVPEEITFTKNTTEALNRVVYEWGVSNLKKGDVIVTTIAEHHSNFIPWQQLAKITGAEVRIVDLDENGDITFENIKKAIDDRVKLVCVLHASNVLGTILSVKEISKVAKKVGAKVVVDGAQSVPHMRINAQSMGCDFFAFSGHKMLGPTGIGVLWVKRDLLDKLGPYEYGGGMIDIVERGSAIWAKAPDKFEAGTQNICGAIALSSAIDYLNSIGMSDIQAHELELNTYLLQKLSEVPDIRIFGSKDPQARTSLVSFTIKNLHPHDVASILDSEGVAVRSGHHCAMPLHTALNSGASTRASFYIYNGKEDVDALVLAVRKAIKLLS